MNPDTDRKEEARRTESRHRVDQAIEDARRTPTDIPRLPDATATLDILHRAARLPRPLADLLRRAR